ncbi:MAG: hypothetical protein SFX18_17115 [Pirellulales bacterium]|nr:hypothetical protein [Pirellulales bacterium]
MRAKLKFGCLRNAVSLNAGIHPLSNMRQWMEEYWYERLNFELPDEGTKSESIECPICAQQVTICLSNAKSKYFLLRVALLIWAIACWGVAALIYIGPGADNTIATYVAYGIGLLGIICLIGTIMGDLLPAQWLKDSLVAITHDEVRNHEQAPGYSGMRGHKLIDIEVS